MSYLVDTDWVVDWLKGRAQAIRLLQSLAGAGTAISLVTYGEVYEGIYYGQDPRLNEAVFRAFLQEVTVVPFDEPIMQRFARIHGGLRRRGLDIGVADALIAATAVEQDLILVTRNVRHFRRVRGLKLHQQP